MYGAFDDFGKNIFGLVVVAFVIGMPVGYFVVKAMIWVFNNLHWGS